METKINIVIPTMGENKSFLDQAQKLISRQTVEPDDVFVVSSLNGITANYKKGYSLCKSGVMLAWEFDDFYNNTFIETIKKQWDDKYDLLGWDTTIYYHLGLRKYRHMHHPNRSSMFCTALKVGLNINWPDDREKFLDTKLWADSELKKKILSSHPPCIGIKHGIGTYGGKGHEEAIYKNHSIEDPEMEYLKGVTQSDKFYTRLSRDLQSS